MPNPTFQSGLSGGNQTAKKYVPAGQCIYCGATKYGTPRDKLGDEHIIPRSIGGTAILPMASCQKCERETSRIENEIKRNHFGAALPHLGIFDKGKRTPDQRRYTRIGEPIADWADPSALHKAKRVDLSKHPGFLMSTAWLGPMILIGGEPSGEVGGALIKQVPVVPNFDARGVAVGGWGTDYVNLANHAKLICKIAHTFAVAELGLSGFDPILPDVIIGKQPAHGHFLLGMADEPPSIHREMHEVGFIDHDWDEFGKFVVVRVRLFARFPTFTHFAVAGRRL